MDAPRVAIPMMVVNRPLKNVATDSPLCFAMGWILVRLWPCSECRPVVVLEVVFGRAGFVKGFV